MRRTALPILLLLAVTVVIYSATFTNGYVWDDWTLFINSPALRAEAISWASVSSPILDGTTYFRPVVLATFVAEFRLFGVSPFVSHVFNLLVQQANVVLVFLLGLKLTRQLGLSAPEVRASLAALFYLVHPSLVESVAWASGRFDLLTTFFTLIALTADAYIGLAWARRLIICVSFAGALGSKELGITLPVLLVLNRLLLDHSGGQTIWMRCLRIVRQEKSTFLICTLILVVYILLRLDSVGGLLHIDRRTWRITPEVSDKALLVLNVFAFYFKEALFPFTSVGPFHPLDFGSITSTKGIAVAALAAVVIGAIAVNTVKGNRQALLLMCALVALLPVSQIVPLTIGGNIGHDRFLTLPLVFVAIALGMVRTVRTRLLRPHAQVFIAAMVAAIWIPGAALTTKVVTSQWKSDLSIWTWTYHQYPDLHMAQLNLISAAIMASRPELAKIVFDRLLENGEPLEALHQVNYGAYLVMMGDATEGSKYIEGALAAFPARHKMNPEEQSIWRSAQYLSYTMASAYSALATAHSKKGEFDEALADIEAALWYKPKWPTLLIQKSNILLALDRIGDSENWFEYGLSLSIPEKVPQELERRAKFTDSLCRDYAAEKLSACGG